VEDGRRLRACGVTCPEIARLLSRTLKAVQAKLRTSRMGRPRANLWEWRLLFSLGLPDAEVARRRGCKLSNVRYFRLRIKREDEAHAAVSDRADGAAASEGGWLLSDVGWRDPGAI
jgi:hypothetical protein